MRRTFIALVLAVPILVGMLCGLLFLEHRGTVALPSPSGTYSVGRLTGLLEESGQRQLLSPKPNEPRQAFIWVWYPANTVSTAQHCDYLPPDWRGVLDKTRGAFNRYILSVDLAHIRDQSFCNVGISSHEVKYPLVLLRAGSSALVSQYTVLAENLASHGYIVLGFDAPYRSEVVVFPNGNYVQRLAANDAESLSGEKQVMLGQALVAAWATDTSWVLNEIGRTPFLANLRDHIDFERIAIVGHSLGGATALQFCHDDPRCKAGVDIDGVLLGNVAKQPLNKPFLILLGGHGEENAEDVRRTLAVLQSFYDHLPGSTRFWVTIEGANHFNFSDIGFLKSRGLQRLLLRLGVMKMDIQRQSELTSSYVRAFLDVHLKGAPAAELQNLPRN